MHIGRWNTWVEGEVRHLRLLMGIACPSGYLPSRHPLILSHRYSVPTIVAYVLFQSVGCGRPSVRKFDVQVSHGFPTHVVDIEFEFPFLIHFGHRPKCDSSGYHLWENQGGGRILDLYTVCQQGTVEMEVA